MEPKLVKVVLNTGEIVHVPPGSKVFVDGMEVPDPTPVEMPLGYEAPETLESMMMRMVRAVSYEISQKGGESIDEANDFDVDDEDSFEELLTPAELDAISVAREVREEVPKEREDGGAKEHSGNSGGREADDGPVDDIERGGSRDGGRRKGARKGVPDREQRGSKSVARRRSYDRSDVEETSEDFGEGDE